MSHNDHLGDLREVGAFSNFGDLFSDLNNGYFDFKILKNSVIWLIWGNSSFKRFEANLKTMNR